MVFCETDTKQHMHFLYPSGAPEFIPGFSGVRVARSLVFYAMLYRSFFFLFVLTIVLSVLLRIMDTDYPFVIFKLFLLYFIDEKIPQMH